MSTPSVIDARLENFQEAVIAESRRRPVVADFWAAWCGPCRALGPLLERLAAEAGGGFLLARIDVDAQPELAREFSIRSIPHLLVFRDGAVVDQMTGALPETEVRRFLHRHCPSPADMAFQMAMKKASGGADVRLELEAVLSLDPDHGGALVELGRIQLAAGDAAAAAALWERVPYGSPFSDRAGRLRELLRLESVCSAAGGPEACAQRAADGPEDLAARYAHACCLTVGGRYQEAMDHLLFVIGRDRNFDGRGAHKAMLAVFSAVGDRDPLTEEYRKRLAMTLF